MSPINYKQFTALLPTAYLPSLTYMVVLISSHKAHIELQETYPKQTWRNRCRINTANGTLDLIVPVNKPQGNHTKTRNVKTSNHEKWQAMHWRAMNSAYGKTPYFMFYKDLLAPFYVNTYSGLLWQFNWDLLETIGKELGMQIPLCTTKVYEKNPRGMTDFRNAIVPKNTGSNHTLVCHWPAYYQVFSERSGFVADLSIIDLLFHIGPDSVQYLEEACQHLVGYPMEG